jgi:hypothetical protein
MTRFFRARVDGGHRQAAYVNAMENDEQIPENVSFYRVSFPELKNLIRGVCHQFDIQEPPATLNSRQIYLRYRLCDQNDSHLKALAAWLENVCAQIGKTVLRSLLEGDPAHIRQHDQSARETSSAVFVYCGLTANNWADEQYNLLKSSRIVYLRRIFYITAGTIDFAPPPDKAYAFEAGGMFDAAAADARLLPLISAD